METGTTVKLKKESYEMLKRIKKDIGIPYAEAVNRALIEKYGKEQK